MYNVEASSESIMDTLSGAQPSAAAKKAPPAAARSKPILGGILPATVTRDQCKDTGMAMVLLLLLLLASRKSEGYLMAAIGVHLLNMIAPQLFRPIAILWFGLSHVMGTIASKVLLTIVFFAVVTPIALWRRMFGADPMQLHTFKQSRGSVMQTRNHTFTGKDLEQPY